MLLWNLKSHIKMWKPKLTLEGKPSKGWIASKLCTQQQPPRVTVEALFRVKANGKLGVTLEDLERYAS
jgi:hypothetical protein